MKGPNLEKTASQIGIPIEELQKLLSCAYEKGGRLPIPFGYKHTKYATSVIKGIQEEISYIFVGRSDFKKNLETAYRLIMCNMVSCVFEKTSLSLSGSEKDYVKGSYYHKLFLTWAAVEKITKALIDHGYIIKNKGSRAAKRVNSYQPTGKLELLSLPLIYTVAEEYNDSTELILFTSSKAGKNTQDQENTRGTMHRSSIRLETNYKSDLLALKRINNILKDCSYALKSPIKRVYSESNPMRGGRLYTRMQSLPDRRARIRINTLFNGAQVAEVDLSANHPRMLMALANKQLSPTFYDDVATATDTTREQVKFLIVKAIGAKNRRISLKPKGKEKSWTSEHLMLSKTQRIAIEDHLLEKYPEIALWLYKDIGVHLQAFEGDILLKAMLTLLEDGIPSLPIHDAIYVQKQHKESARAALNNAWKDVMDVSFFPVTKIDVSRG